MIDSAPDNPSPPPAARPEPVPAARRTHTYSRLTTAIAVLALATAAYALWRLDTTRDLVDELAAERVRLSAEIQGVEQRERAARQELERRLAALDEVPRQVQELANATEELRGRTQGPERAWSRAEAMYLLELAQRRLALNRDVETAIVALEAADARLASLRDASFAGVRQQIAREVQSLRAVDLPDTTGISARLAALEERAASLPVKGITAAEPREQAQRDLPDGFFARAWAILRNAAGNLIRVREVDRSGGGFVTKEEALMRRAHLELLLFTARSAVARGDGEAYRNAIAGARRWLGEVFDLSSPAAQSFVKELQALEPVRIDPPLPDISGSSKALRKLMPVSEGPE